MAEVRWFYRTLADWTALVDRLKQTACPHCRVVGALIRHGVLAGYDDTSQGQIVRARRLYCSNRHARPGCGRTVSVWLATTLRRLSLTSSTLLRFLQQAATGTIAAAGRAAAAVRSERTWQRLWHRFDRAQSRLRTALAGLCPPPPPTTPPPTPGQRPAAHVLAHLAAAFPAVLCPIAACQHALRTCFLEAGAVLTR